MLLWKPRINEIRQPAEVCSGPNRYQFLSCREALNIENCVHDGSASRSEDQDGVPAAREEFI
ncbi:hypothetical protein [Cupriavidus sp. USMAA2-4]|uniref:hypothetical protein n=1 Tax=Cupriavidus sp. USMAA2-4 TaxID=876364 RepID=UPI0012F4E01F|nr:hypothetical protein [Cupriavidus sp. USMAA2-4]